MFFLDHPDVSEITVITCKITHRSAEYQHKCWHICCIMLQEGANLGPTEGENL